MTERTQDQTLRIEAFAQQYLPGAVRLSQQAGWPHRAADWAFTAAVSKGFVGIENGEVVATAFCSEFGDFCTINMIIVDAAMRGRGLGRRMMDRVIAAAQGRGMSLVATADGLPLYEKLGFRATGEVVQHQGIVTEVPALPEGFATPRIATRDDLPVIAAMDRAACGADRFAMLSNLFDIATIRICDTGFASVRDFGRGRTVGPVVARDAMTARGLIAASAATGGFLRLDTRPDCGLSDFLTAMGLSPVGGGITMHCGPARPAAKEFMTYALTSQALG
uniref:GNAT family N-acetyltransferase n=1 Tax=Paenirhodobacter enshiensis TaxID=1105367 RepID=UPI0035B24041